MAHDPELIAELKRNTAAQADLAKALRKKAQADEKLADAVQMQAAAIHALADAIASAGGEQPAADEAPSAPAFGYMDARG